MIETICNRITSKIRSEMPEVDDERAEIINYGLQLIIGEIPKIFITIAIAWAIGVLELTILAVVVILPYRKVSGGVHLKTHVGCVVATTLFYIGNAMLSKYIVMTKMVRYLITLIVWIISAIMIKLYAPADTEAVPILREKERKTKKILSYIIMTLSLIISIILTNETISNLILFGIILQTITITRFMYKITNNKYGYEEYYKNSSL